MKNVYFKILTFLTLLLSVSLGFSQSQLSKSSYAALVSDHIKSVGKDYGLTANDVKDLYINSEVFSKGSQTTSLYINQQFQGIKIYNAVSTVVIKNNEVLYFANNFIGQIDAKVNTITPTINAQQAILKALNHFEISGLTSLRVLSSEGNSYIFSNGNVSGVDIPVTLNLTPLKDGNMRLTWDLSIQELDNAHWWSVRVDAVTGEIIDVADWILSCDFGEFDLKTTSAISSNKSQENFSMFKPSASFMDGSQYRVFALPTQSPSHGGRSLLVDPADANASPFGWHDTNALPGAELTTSNGNNVFASEDRDNTPGVGYSPDGGASLNFDFELDLNQAPAVYEDASLTNLFYMNNAMHDIWYQYGFDEASGNFQRNNYGNGGSGNDPVFASGQDGAGLNNATFGTPPDGSVPAMTMFLWGESQLKNLVTVNNGPLAGPYVSFNPSTALGNNITGASTTPVTGNLIIVDDGTLKPTEGCNALVNAASVSGKIALIKRGTCGFVQKIQQAQDAGAIGVIMMNHNNPDNDPNYAPYVVMGGSSTPAFTIPSVFVNYQDGLAMATALNNGQTINVTLQDYDLFQLDGSLDNTIVSHEYGHGISNRLTGGRFSSNCLTNPEQMGEGWSDWFALMITMKAEDTPEQPRGIATYSSGQPNDGVGIREANYSTDFSINNFTYGRTNDDTILGTIDGEPVTWNEIPHNVGSIWASMLWDLNWAYIEKYGFDADLYNGTGGNNKVMQLVIDGLKFQTCNPGFVDGRNALLVADQLLTDGEDQCMIWEVFANRGLGFNASQGEDGNMEDQVEDFSLPPSNDASLANCTSLSVQESKVNTYEIYPNPATNEINIRVTQNYGSAQVSLVDINGRSVYKQQMDLNGTVTVNFGQLQAGIYILNVNNNTININEKIIIK